MPAIDLTQIAARESEQVEWKENVADENDVVKTLAAFANDLPNLGGGYVVCGVREERDEHGFARMVAVGLTASRLKEIEGIVMTRCREQVTPSIVPIVEEVPAMVADRRVLVFTMPATRQAHAVRTHEGTKYDVRISRQTREARNGVFRDLMVRKSAVEPWDRRACDGATVADLDLLVLRDAMQRLGETASGLSVDQIVSADVALSALVPPLCVREPLTGILRPRNFAILLFGRSIQRFVPGAVSFFSIYPGPDRSEPFGQREELTGTLLDQARRLIELLNAQAPTNFNKLDAVTPNTVKYPRRALHEAMVNALVHRDYELADPTRVTAFSNRIEIDSPGSLPLGIEPEMFRLGRAGGPRWRNQALAWFLMRMQLAQAEGQGVPTILKTMQDAGCPPPSFQANAGRVLCVLSAHPAHARVREVGAEEAILTDYRAHVLATHSRLELIGLGAGDYPLPLDDLYVPLRTSCQPEAPSARELARSDDIDLTHVFAHTPTDRPHVVLLGEPGAGKSTALQKLLLAAFQSPDQLPGLDVGCVPVLLRLRDLTADDTEAQSLEPVLARLLGDPARAAVIWRQPHLLLLLDGLDEVSDTLRPEVARFLRNAVSRSKHVRAVVTSRIAGYGDDVRLGEAFTTFVLQPLSSAQIFAFIRQWFRVAQSTVRNLDAERARKEADRLIDALTRDSYSNQHLMSLVGSPLLLTLLCIVVLRGGEIPRQRVQFYDRCLRVLLETWRKAQARTDPLLLPDMAIQVLKPVAYRLHATKRLEVGAAELANQLDAELFARKLAPTGFAVVEWLHEISGLLMSPAPGRFRFLHLVFQEYLTALHVADDGDSLRAHLVQHAGDNWWREVALLYVAVPERATCGPFVHALLATPDPLAHEELIKACLETAWQPDITPILDRLAHETDPERQAFLLRLVNGHRHPRLNALARALSTSAHHDVRARAAQVIEHEQGALQAYDVVVLHGAGSIAQVDHLRAELARAQISMRAFAIENLAALAREAPMLAGRVRGFVALTGEGDATWHDPGLLANLEVLARRAPWRAVLHAGKSPLAGVLRDVTPFDDVAKLAGWIVDTGASK